MILLVGYYQERSPERAAELLACLRRNCSNDHIRAVHVFLEGDAGPGLQGAKLRTIPFGRRVRFCDLFAYANRNLQGQPTIIANSDIFFDHTLARLHGYDLDGKLLCLSRWDVDPDGTTRLYEQPWSQDAWIFRAPARPFQADWHLGLPGCENRMAHEARQAGMLLVNPSRTVHANHLHLSGVRNYNDGQRLYGAGCSVEPDWLHAPWLWPVVACMGRGADVRASFGSIAAQAKASPILVDYACPDQIGDWVRATYPGATVVRVPDRFGFNIAEARNAGAAATDGDAVLCFLDADVRLAEGFAQELLARFDERCYLVPDDGRDQGSTLVCSRRAFDSVGGFDPNYLAWGGLECADLRQALGRAGLAERSFPACLLGRNERPAGAPAVHAPWPGLETVREINHAYRRVKSALVGESGDRVQPSTLRDIRRSITHRLLAERGAVPDAPCARAEFCEAMGYTVAELVPGASSHNNEQRPFDAIPGPLHGLAYTQVVPARVSPVRVELLSQGKLYVLVGTDWYGYHIAIRHLRGCGYREPLPPLTTRRGTGFEVWSLRGEPGDSWELPTQVMLAARELRARA